MKKVWKSLTLGAVAIWVLIGVYGIVYNITYVDEAKYLIKGWLMATGQVGYYSTSEFFYQHMPGGLLWYGLGQKLLGPSLEMARLQSFILGLVIFYLSYLLAQKIGGKKAGQLSLMILSLMPVVSLYYSSAVPQSLAVLMLLLGFLFLFDKKYLWSSFWFTMAFVVRENFLFTWLFYLLFLITLLKKDLKKLGLNFLIAGLTLGVFIIPGLPIILNVFKNFPGLNLLLPINPPEKIVLRNLWSRQTLDINLYFKALIEFGAIYYIWIIGLLLVGWGVVKNKMKMPKDKPWWFLVFISGFNLIAHSWSAFNTSPRAIVSYFAYVAPLMAVIMAVLLVAKINKKNLKYVAIVYGLLVLLIPVNLGFSSLFTSIGKKPNLWLINKSIKPLKKIISVKDKIIWLAEPLPLYLAGKVSYYPLINHTNSYKPLGETEVVKNLGFWNSEMMEQWLDEAELVVVDENRLKLLEQNPLTLALPKMVEERLESDYEIIEVKEYIWPGNLKFYEKSLATR